MLGKPHVVFIGSAAVGMRTQFNGDRILFHDCYQVIQRGFRVFPDIPFVKVIINILQFEFPVHRQFVQQKVPGKGKIGFCFLNIKREWEAIGDGTVLHGFHEVVCAFFHRGFKTSV